MLALGKLLELTLAGREPAEKTQLTVEGVRMRWLSEGALEVRPPKLATMAWTCCCRRASTATKQRRSNCSIACCMASPAVI
jgi:hypothetical protein